jgi:hypothetical protein
VAPSHADQVPSIRLGLPTSRAAPSAEHGKDHARGTEALISRPCSMLVLARGNRLWRPALKRPRGNGFCDECHRLATELGAAMHGPLPQAPRGTKLPPERLPRAVGRR